MAYVTGTASGHIDLWDKLIAFLTTNPELVAVSRQWEIAWTHPTQARTLVVRGKGSSGTESIYIGLQLVTGVSSDAHYIACWGMSGIIPGAIDMVGHVNVSPGVRMWLDAAAMKYWFVANARRFSIVANMSTVYETLYAGFFLPYVQPSRYPYPLIIGGTSNHQWTGNLSVTGWRSQSSHHTYYWAKFFNDQYGAGYLPFRTNAYAIDPQGVWLSSSSHKDVDLTVGEIYYRAEDLDAVYRWGDANEGRNYRFGKDIVRQRAVQIYGGGFAIEPMTLMKNFGAQMTYGTLDGIYRTTGMSNSVENIISIDGKDHLVVQNVFRTEIDQYCVMRLD